MKKATLALFVVAFVTFMCFAVSASAQSDTDKSANPIQASSKSDILSRVPRVTVDSTQSADRTTPSVSDKTDSFTGRVDSVMNGQIFSTDDKGQQAAFTVASDAVVIGKDGNSSSLNWISKGDKVKIGYIANTDGSKTAKAIKVSSDW
ncbi:MAG: hypothetical protein LHV69_11695 [Elusimicrobia bacterium]|nr:hypothetical protein [Candidatus Obscuribacterium magneticum]